MERVWNTLRGRINIMRGFKAAWSAKLLVNGFFIWYDMIGPLMCLRCTPAEVVGLGQMTFKEMIEKATNF